MRLLSGTTEIDFMARRKAAMVASGVLLLISLLALASVLALGAHLKNTFCIAAGDTAYFGPHIGDLETVAALSFFEEAVERMESILSIRPDVFAHDLHPGYLSTRYALARSAAHHVGVQHTMRMSSARWPSMASEDRCWVLRSMERGPGPTVRLGGVSFSFALKVISRGSPPSSESSTKPKPFA